MGSPVGDYYNCSAPEEPYQCLECKDYFWELNEEELCETCAIICPVCGGHPGDEARNCECCGEVVCASCIPKPEVRCDNCDQEVEDDARLGAMLRKLAKGRFKIYGTDFLVRSDGKRFYACSYREDGKRVFGYGPSVYTAVEDALELMKAERAKAA